MYTITAISSSVLQLSCWLYRLWLQMEPNVHAIHHNCSASHRSNPLLVRTYHMRTHMLLHKYDVVHRNGIAGDWNLLWTFIIFLRLAYFRKSHESVIPIGRHTILHIELYPDRLVREINSQLRSEMCLDWSLIVFMLHSDLFSHIRSFAVFSP